MLLRSLEKTRSDKSGRKKSRKISEKSDLVSIVKRIGDTQKNSEQVELWIKVMRRKEKNRTVKKEERKLCTRRTEEQKKV